MKRIIGFIFIMISIFLTAFAAPGDEIGKVYSTDILAYVNGKPIDSYNIGGKTVFIAEDLTYYGFFVTYDDQSRLLTIDSAGYTGGGQNIGEIKRGKVGEITGKVYDTDIKVIFNGKEVKGYNLGGRTAICIEDLGTYDQSSKNFAYGFSDYVCNAVWNSEERTISLETFTTDYEYNFGYYHKVQYTLEGNVLKAQYDNMNPYYSTINYTGGTSIETGVITPVYIEAENKKTEIGQLLLTQNGTIPIIKCDLEASEKAVRHIIKNLTYDEAFDFINENYEIEKTFENDDYTIVSAITKDADANGKYAIAVKKTGGMICFEHLGPNQNLDIKFNGNEAEFIIFPFGGPHGTTTMHVKYNLDWYSFADDASLDFDENWTLCLYNDYKNPENEKADCYVLNAILNDDLSFDCTGEFYQNSYNVYLSKNENGAQIGFSFAANSFNNMDNVISMLESLVCNRYSEYTKNPADVYADLNAAASVKINGEKIHVKELWRSQGNNHVDYILKLDSCPAKNTIKTIDIEIR